MNAIFSKISPYANADRNITNAKTNIVNKMFILFDDSDNVKLFSNKGEYEIHFFDSQTNTIQFRKYQESIVFDDSRLEQEALLEDEQSLSEEDQGESDHAPHPSQLYGSERLFETGSQQMSESK